MNCNTVRGLESVVPPTASPDKVIYRYITNTFITREYVFFSDPIMMAKTRRYLNIQRMSLLFYYTLLLPKKCVKSDVKYLINNFQKHSISFIIYSIYYHVKYRCYERQLYYLYICTNVNV